MFWNLILSWTARSTAGANPHNSGVNFYGTTWLDIELGAHPWFRQM
jgi:hypothetical protein